MLILWYLHKYVISTVFVCFVGSELGACEWIWLKPKINEYPCLNGGSERRNGGGVMGEDQHSWEAVKTPSKQNIIMLMRTLEKQTTVCNIFVWRWVEWGDIGHQSEASDRSALVKGNGEWWCITTTSLPNRDRNSELLNPLKLCGRMECLYCYSWQYIIPPCKIVQIWTGLILERIWWGYSRSRLWQ
jgi:hypothetical protein